MMTDINLVLQEAQTGMEDAVKHLESIFSKLRAGKASTSLVEDILIECYGTQSPISQIAAVGTPDSNTITIQPWDKSIIKDIEKSIIKSNLGINPQNDGNIIRLNIPALTEERRRDLVKITKNEMEDCKVSIRNTRQKANDTLKKMEKNDEITEDDNKTAQKEIQNMTDKFSQKSEEIFKKKEEEIMTV